MDEELSVAVREAFVRLYHQGLIYRGAYIVNWCPRCQTAISDLEVVHQEQKGHLWEIRYPVIDADGKDSGEFLTVATTRPETMLGDTAVAIHPEDERYLHLHGKKLRLPLMNREIPIILDEWVSRDFGTGAVKVTPAHDPNDFALAERHHLPSINVMDDRGHINAEGGAYAGLDRYVARKKIVADLAEPHNALVAHVHHNLVFLVLFHATRRPHLDRNLGVGVFRAVVATATDLNGTHLVENVICRGVPDNHDGPKRQAFATLERQCWKPHQILVGFSLFDL